MIEEIKRNKDGTIDGVATMGDFVQKEELTPEQKEIKRKIEELERKYGH